MHTHIYTSRGETLVSVLVGVFILSIVVFGVANLLVNNSALEDESRRNTALMILEQNATSIIKNLNTAQIAEKEVFYLYKDPTTQTITAFTGATNIGYAYVNAAGENVSNTGSYQNSLYYQSFIIDQSDTGLRSGSQVVKGTIRELVRRSR
jgi:Tfp pilus assembly protein PilV